jgi:DNA polymerase-3 subunit beta
MDITYREKVDATSRELWRACVHAERLNAFVAGAPADGDVGLRADDEGRLAIRSGRASCRLPTLPADNFPLFNRPNEGAVELTVDATALVAGLRAVAPAISTEEARYHLCGAFLHSGRLCATDGHRLALATIAADMPPAPDVIVPGSTVTRLLPLLRGLEGPISVTVSKTLVIVSASNWTLTSKVIDGTFPDYRRILPEHSPRPLLVQRDALRSAAALVASVHHSEKKTRGLRLAIVDGELQLMSAGEDSLGTCEVTVGIESELSAVPCPVALNPRYLLDALGVIDAELVELHIVDPSSSVWLCAAGEAHDGSIIMPMRV